MELIDKYIKLLDSNKELNDMFLEVCDLCLDLEVAVNFCITAHCSYRVGFDAFKKCYEYTYKYASEELLDVMPKIISRYNKQVKERLSRKEK